MWEMNVTFPYPILREICTYLSKSTVCSLREVHPSLAQKIDMMAYDETYWNSMIALCFPHQSPYLVGPEAMLRYFDLTQFPSTLRRGSWDNERGELWHLVTRHLDEDYRYQSSATAEDKEDDELEFAPDEEVDTGFLEPDVDTTQPLLSSPPDLEDMEMSEEETREPIRLFTDDDMLPMTFVEERTARWDSQSDASLKPLWSLKYQVYTRGSEKWIKIQGPANLVIVQEHHNSFDGFYISGEVDERFESSYLVYLREGRLEYFLISFNKNGKATFLVHGEVTDVIDHYSYRFLSHPRPELSACADDEVLDEGDVVLYLFLTADGTVHYIDRMLSFNSIFNGDDYAPDLELIKIEPSSDEYVSGSWIREGKERIVLVVNKDTVTVTVEGEITFFRPRKSVPKIVAPKVVTSAQPKAAAKKPVPVMIPKSFLAKPSPTK